MKPLLAVICAQATNPIVSTVTTTNIVATVPSRMIVSVISVVVMSARLAMSMWRGVGLGERADGILQLLHTVSRNNPNNDMISLYVAVNSILREYVSFNIDHVTTDL